MWLLDIFTKPKLTWDLVVKTAGSKGPCAARFNYDIDKRKIIPIPYKFRSPELVARILKINIEDLKLPENIEKEEREIPFNIEINKEQEIVGLMTGFSSLEMNYGIRHEKKHLFYAHKAALQFIEKSDIKKSKDFHAMIYPKFVK